MENYNDIFKNSYKKVSSFFGILPKNIKLHIITDLDKISKIFNIDINKIPWYACGFYKENDVYVLSPELLKKRGHKKEELKNIITHELCHVFIKKLVKKQIPVWIEEGISQYIAFGNFGRYKKQVNITELNSYDDWYRLSDPYIYCSNFFEFLINRYGKEKILLFLKLLNSCEYKHAFKRIFNLEINKAEQDFRKENAKVV